MSQETVTTVFDEIVARFSLPCERERAYYVPDVEFVRDHQDILTTGAQKSVYDQLLLKPDFLKTLAFATESDNQNYDPHDPLHAKNFSENYRLVGSVLGLMGIEDPEGCFKSWHYVNGETNHYGTLRNITRLAELQAKEPAVAGILQQAYGIRRFSRYSAQMLLSQYLATSSDRPYGLIVSSVGDHCGAFEHANLDGLVNQLEPSHDAIICEAAEEQELKDRVVEQATDRGPADFLIIRGHGDRTGIVLGQGDSRLALGSDLSDIAHVLAPHASVVLESCSTGQIGGIAQYISQELRASVVAPDGVSNCWSKINVVRSQSGLQLLPDYTPLLGKRDAAPPKVMFYTNGKLNT